MSCAMSSDIGLRSTLVFDIGSAFVRCGMAGEAQPRHILRAPMPPEGHKMLRSNEKAAWVEVLSPLLDSLITDFLLCRPQDRRVVVVEPLAGPSAIREALAEVLFRNLGVPTVSFVHGLLPVLYASGGLSGVVLDVGKDEAHVLATWRGVPILSSYRVSPRGFSTVCLHLGILIDSENRDESVGDGYENHLCDFAVAEELASRVCRVRVRENTGIAHDGAQAKAVLLPMTLTVGEDLQQVKISGSMRSDAPDELFDEDGAEGEGAGLGSLVVSCLQRSPIDLRALLARRIVAAGGGSMLPGFGCRLEWEIRREATKREMKWADSVKVIQTSFPGDLMLWIGTSIMAAAGLTNRTSVCVSKDSYYKHDAAALPEWLR